MVILCSMFRFIVVVLLAVVGAIVVFVVGVFYGTAWPRGLDVLGRFDPGFCRGSGRCGARKGETVASCRADQRSLLFLVSFTFPWDCDGVAILLVRVPWHVCSTFARLLTMNTAC